jgi:hypothetical protein
MCTILLDCPVLACWHHRFRPGKGDRCTCHHRKPT